MTIEFWTILLSDEIIYFSASQLLEPISFFGKLHGFYRDPIWNSTNSFWPLHYWNSTSFLKSLLLSEWTHVRWSAKRIFRFIKEVLFFPVHFYQSVHSCYFWKYENLKKKCAGAYSFWGEIDIEHTRWNLISTCRCNLLTFITLIFKSNPFPYYSMRILLWSFHFQWL